MTKELTVMDVRKAIESEGLLTTSFADVPRDEVLETIADLDGLLASAEEFVEYIQEQREKLLNRAMVENIEKSGNYYLITIPGPMKRNPINNIVKFAERFPDAYSAIRKQQAEAIEAKMTKELDRLKFSEIPLTLADAKLGKDTVTEYVGFKAQEVRAEVRKMPEKLNCGDKP